MEIRRLINELGAERTVLLSTHVLPEVQHMCPRLVVIHKGRIAADGSVEVLTAHAEGAARIRVELQGDGVMEGLRGLDGVAAVEDPRPAEAGRVATHLTTDGSRDLRPAIFELAKTRGWTLYELSQESRSLEDLFRQLTSGDVVAEAGADESAPAGAEERDG